jgi:hypothetical protein
VGTALRVDAGFSQTEALDGSTLAEMLLDYLLDVPRMDVAVPDGLRIDDDDWTVLALVEAAGFVGANLKFEASILDRVLEGGFELFGPLGEAAGSRGSFVAFVRADEDVVFKKWHFRWIRPAGEGCMGVGNV